MIIPAARPRIRRETVEDALDHLGDDEYKHQVMLYKIRGYYTDMGERGVNDVGIYDDCSVTIGPGIYATFNHNTDPSKIGWNPGVGKPFGLALPQKMYFRLGIHHPGKPSAHKALRQMTDEEAHAAGLPEEKAQITVLRCWGLGDKRNYVERGYFALNDHLGGNNTTSSWMCHTTPPDEYWERYKQIESAMNKFDQKYIACRLVEI